MTSIKLNKSDNHSFTLISNNFIDKYMPQADGTYVKVYLYLLRCITSGSIDITICSIADALDTSDRDIVRALTYWERVELIQLDKNSSGDITSIMFVEDNTNSVVTQTITPAPAPTPTPEYISTEEIIPMEILLDNADFKEMRAIIEGMLGRPINNTEINLITNLYSKYHFRADLIIYLFEECIPKCNGNSKFIEKVGMDWATLGIDSLDAASDYSLEHSEIYYGVVKAFGINNRGLGKPELDFLKKWINEYNFSKEYIVLACQKTLSAIGSISFSYADSILVKWRKNNVKSMEDVEILDKEFKEQEAKSAKVSTKSSNVHKFNFEQRNYSDTDYDDLEKRAMAKYLS